MLPPLEAAAKLGIGLRPATNEDLPFIARLYASTRAEEMALTGWPQEQQAAFLAQQHEAQHRHYRQHYPVAEWLIVERGGAAIGRLYLGESEGELRVIDISLLPAARGEGIGGAILSDILCQAEASGKRVIIHVEQSNPARRLYARLGFRIVDDQGVYLRMEWPSPTGE